MKELLTFVAQNLVLHPESVQVDEQDNGRETTLTLHVADGDLGQVIGHSGRIARSVRTLIRSADTRKNSFVRVEISD